MKAKIGLWSDPHPIQPQDWRHGTKSPLLLDANGCRTTSEPIIGPVVGNSRSCRLSPGSQLSVTAVMRQALEETSYGASAMRDLPEHIRRNRDKWDKAAAEYAQAGEEAWARAAPVWGIWKIPESQAGLLTEGLGGRDAIELGCGTAYVSAWLARRGARIVGIDNSRAQLATARRLQREYGLDFPLIHGNAESMPHPDASFDFAISEYGACLWADPHRWIPEAARVLRPGGQLVFLTNSFLLMLCMPDEAGVTASDRLLRPAFRMPRLEWPDDPGVEFHLSHGDWIRVLRVSGFEIEDLIELRPAERATCRNPFVTLEWARKWPCEEVWKVRKTRMKLAVRRGARSSFQARLADRDVETYASFFLRHVRRGMRVLDCGCGNGTITVGLAKTTAAVGVDRKRIGFRSALEYARAHRISGLSFVTGDVFHLPFSDAAFDAVLAHSILETLVNPVEALREIRRVLKRGGLVGAASVDYGALILSPDPSELLANFYELRKQQWKVARIADPYRGRLLRSLLTEAGFQRVSGSARYLSYGTPRDVRHFGLQRARECAGGGFREGVLTHRLTDAETLDAMANAWKEWSSAPGAFLAFAWCDAVGWK